MPRQTRPLAAAPVAPHVSLASADAPWAAWPWDAVPAQFAAVWFDQFAAVQAAWLQAMLALPAMPARMPFPPAWPAAATSADGTDTSANDAVVRMLDLGQWAVESATACWLNACKPAHTDEIVA